MADNKSFESSLHDIVYSIDAGTGLKIIRVGLYILLVLVIVLVYTATQFRGLKSEEAMDYCQLGRNISFEQGLVTKTVRPLTMWKLQQHNADENPMIGTHPDLYHAPAYPLFLSFGFKAFELFGLDPFAMPEDMHIGRMLPAEQWVVIPVNHLFAILTGWMLLSMGKRLFSREIGLIGMSIYYLSNVVWDDAITGLNISMAIFFSVAAFHAMITSMLNKRDGLPKAKWVTPFVVSLISAVIAFYTRYITIAVVPGICLFAWLMSGRFRGGTKFVVIFGLLYMVLIAPWLVRNYQACGNPIGMVGYAALSETRAYPENTLERNYEPEVGLKMFSAVLKEKWVANYSEKHDVVIPAMGGGLLMALFLVTFLYHFVRPHVNYLRWGLAVSMLCMLVIAGFFSDSSMRMLHLFWPFAILYGLGFFYILIDRLDLGVRLYNTGLKWLIVILAFVPLLMKVLPPHANRAYPPYHVPIINYVGNLLGEREVLCTDMPWATAWYGDRVSILLPTDLDQFYEINDYKQYISGMYISPLTKGKPFAELVAGREKSWWNIMNARTPSDFPLKQALPMDGVNQIFLSDRNRWAAGAEQAE